MQRLLVASVIFHHSNLELPERPERRLQTWIVTPRLHGIHHSTRAADTNSNFSSLLSCWDRLHRSLRVDTPQSAITIGVDGYLEPKEVTFARCVMQPFVAQRALPPASSGV